MIKSPKNHHKQVYYQTKTSTSFSGLQGIKIASKEATYKQRLPDPSLKNWGILVRTGGTSDTPLVLLDITKRRAQNFIKHPADRSRLKIPSSGLGA